MFTEDKNIPKSESHFPEDPSAANITVKRSFIKEFYYRNKREADYTFTIVLILTTLITVSFSVYIVIVKYF